MVRMMKHNYKVNDKLKIIWPDKSYMFAIVHHIDLDGMPRVKEVDIPINEYNDFRLDDFNYYGYGLVIIKATPAEQVLYFDK